MKIEFVSIKGFRCFDEAGVVVKLDDLTCLVGPNASGKTASMMALARMFGESPSQRQIVSSDFYLGEGESLKDNEERSLSVECRLAFPELEGEDGQDTQAVPEIFNQMIVDGPEGTPFCRIRLDAKWINDGTPLGDIEQTLSWILTPSEDPAVIVDGNLRKVQPGDRAKIRVSYVPASRDPDQQIRSTTTASIGGLLRLLTWAGAEESLKKKLSEVQEELSGLGGIKTINDQVQKSWSRFYDGKIAREVVFQALEEDPAQLVKHLVPVFRPGEDGRPFDSSSLSDGLRSLFSLSLSIGLYQLEKVLKESAVQAGFKAEVSNNLPILTLFAVEEPENHLSPHYIGKIVGELNKISEDASSQVIISSHSPSILGRIEPDNIRYFLGHENTETTTIKTIFLPDDEGDESYKYVREAVRGYPELYFSRLVILGEGASEEIVLKHLFEVSGTPLDTSFISVVPLGGRHVNHFWRLLHSLDIPFLTLLDLDLEKEGAGWAVSNMYEIS